MAEQTGIEWPHHTLNFWWGCQKVAGSPGCAHCYAEALSKRYGRAIWGKPEETERWRTKGPWRDVFRWDAKAGAAGERRRVFVQSMSDFFEDHPQVAPWREEACKILVELKNLDVLLLTKRPENIRSMVPERWLEQWPAHIWIGTSVENQKLADRRIPLLLEVPAAVRFLSCEPLLGPIDLGLLGTVPNCLDNGGRYELGADRIHWVIVGGESGPKARVMRPSWARSLRDQCVAAGVDFFFKQWGEYGPCDLKGIGSTDHPDCVHRWGKKKAGRSLDGVVWEQVPSTPL